MERNVALKRRGGKTTATRNPTTQLGLRRKWEGMLGKIDAGNTVTYLFVHGPRKNWRRHKKKLKKRGKKSSKDVILNIRFP